LKTRMRLDLLPDLGNTRRAFSSLSGIGVSFEVLRAVSFSDCVPIFRLSIVGFGVRRKIRETA